MSDLLFILLGVSSAYVFIYSFKLYQFYRRCKQAELQGNYIECSGTVAELLEKKVRNVNGKMVTISFPRYIADYGETTLDYISKVKKANIEVNSSVVLLYAESAGLIWAKDDLPLLKRQIIGRLLIPVVLFVAFSIAHLLLTS
ncbi:MAG: hypothetical protein FWE05_04925 [Defluviitaleaceae bacterium]|nr:hypothetical protein [Defluviitaleaceae bacterium]